MKGICIVGAAKTGTTGAYAALRDGLVRSGRPFYSIFEKYWQHQYRSLWHFAPDHTILAKMLLTNPNFDARFFAAFDHRILMARDPRDTLVSTLLYFPVVAVNRGADEQTIEQFVSLVERKEKEPSSVTVRDLLVRLHGISRAPHPDTDFSGRFDQTVELADTVPAHVLRYEHLVTDQIQELADHLTLELRTRRSNDFTDLIFRRGGFGDWKNWFTPADVDHYRPLLAGYMQRFGYADDWELSTDPVLDPDDGSGYVRRSCQRRREQSDLRTRRGTRSPARLSLLRDRADDGAQRDARELARILVDDPSLAVAADEPYQRALFVARGGDYRGMRLVRRCLEKGIGTPVDPRAAARWENEMRLEGARVDTARERDALREELVDRRAEIRALRAEIDRIKGSRRYRIGDRVVRLGHRLRRPLQPLRAGTPAVRSERASRA